MDTVVEVVKVEVPAGLATAEGAQAKALADRAKALTVQAREDEGPVADALSEVARMRGRFDSVRQGIVRPLNEHVKRINEAFRAALGPLDGAEAHLRGQVSDFRRREAEREARERRERDEAERRASEAAKALAAANVPAETISKIVEPPPPPPTPAVKGATRSASGAGVKMVRRWRFEVEDISKVPATFLLVNDAAVLGALRAGATIPGIRGYQEEEVARA